MSLITSAKCVKLHLTHSYHAHVVAAAIFGALIWALLLSPLPLVVTVVFLRMMFSVPLTSWLTSPLDGDVDIDFSGYLYAKEERHVIQRVSGLFAEWFIVIEGTEKRWLLWRDSCCESDYRQLLVRLKREL